MADFDDLKAGVVEDWKSGAAWREAAATEYDFKNGHQWEESDKLEMAETKRLPVVFNRTAVILSSVAGSEINNRTEVRFIPREIGDAKPNEVLSAGAKWFRDEAHAEDEESQAFEDVLVCGIGTTETLMDYMSDPDGSPRIVRIEPMEMAWDSNAHRKALQDATRVSRVRRIATEEARDMFPDAEPGDIDADWIDPSGLEGGSHRTIVGDQYRLGGQPIGDATAKTVTVVQVQWRERERSVEYVDPTDGQKKTMTRAEWEKLAKVMPVDLVIEHREISQYVWRQAFLGRSGILLENQPCRDACTFKFITGVWDRKEKRFYGLLRSMMDPQRYANKWLSQSLHIINSNAKGGVMYEDGAVEDSADFEENWAAADSAQRVMAGALTQGRIQPKPQVQMPAAMMQLTQHAIAAIRDVSGVSEELMGMVGRQQAGVVESHRKQASMTTLATYFDALRFYRKLQGEVILAFLRDYIAPTGRLVRIVKDGLEQYVSLATEAMTRRFDTIVDDSPSAPNEKERTWATMQSLLPVMREAGMGLEDWADVLDYSPLPSSFPAKLRAKAEEQKKQPQGQAADPMAQAEMQKTLSEAQENESQTQLNLVRAQQEAAQVMVPRPFGAS